MNLLPVFLLPFLAQDPVQWTLSLDSKTAPPGGKVLARLTATVEPGWHLYSATTPPGPIPTRIGLTPNDRVAGSKVYQPKPIVKFDPNFNANSEFYEGSAVFLIPVEIAAAAAPGTMTLEGQARYQVCSDRLCLRPVTKKAPATLQVMAGVTVPAVVIPGGYMEVVARAKPAAAAQPPAAAKSAQAEGMGRFLLVAFGFGLAAIFTPCVFPMIPITMSFFLNQRAGTRRDSIVQATVFCLGIIVLFTGLGLVTTAALGPFGVVQLGSNVWVNSFITLVFLAFGLSLLGAFEITLPSSLLTSLDKASQRGGFLGTLLMGLTFSLTAFACVGPFVGTLLAASVQGGGIQPLVGMASFATGLSAPFFFLAIFPAYLTRLPKSGAWLARVKVVLGFVILAAMLKYLSNIDLVMQWNLITRERFLSAWVVLFAMPGLYLLGLVRLEGIKADEHVGVGRALAGAAFLIFAISLIPGMFGGRLGELDAYVPTVTSGGGLASAAAGPGGHKWLKDNYSEALAKARQENKLVFVNFTGYACTNCHWMKSNMFPRTEIAEALGSFVLLELYTDGTDAASEANQQLQTRKFASVAIPYYAILDADENIIARFEGLTRDAKEFLAFLKTSAPPRASAGL